jgi:hypothetical protein
LNFYRHVIDDNRILLVLTDGSQGFEIKDFLIKQDRCKEVTIDNRPYYGKGATVSKCFYLFLIQTFLFLLGRR